MHNCSHAYYISLPSHPKSVLYVLAVLNLKQILYDSPAKNSIFAIYISVDTRKADNDTRKADVDARKADNDARKANVDTRKADNDARKAGVDPRKGSVEQKEAMLKL